MKTFMKSFEFEELVVLLLVIGLIIRSFRDPGAGDAFNQVALIGVGAYLRGMTPLRQKNPNDR